MPTSETLERLIARVESNARAEACEEFHAESASMRENQATPLVGQDRHHDPVLLRPSDPVGPELEP